MESIVIVPNYCQPTLVEGSCTYEKWRGRHKDLYKEDMEANDWFYY